MSEKLTPVERSRRMQAAQTLCEAATILSVYKKGDIDFAQKLMDYADEIAPNRGQ